MRQRKFSSSLACTHQCLTIMTSDCVFSHVASMHGHLHCVKFLLRQPGVDIHARDRWRASPLSGKNRRYVYCSREIFLSANILSYADLGVPANSRLTSCLGLLMFQKVEHYREKLRERLALNNALTRITCVLSFPS